MESRSRLEFNNYLFRYRTVNDINIAALKNNHLYFSTPENFNDPYDNLIYANIEKILFDVLDNLYIGMDSYLKNLKKTNPEMAFIGTKFWNGPEREEMLSSFLGNISTAVKYIKDSVRHNVKIICFSEVYNSMLMWSHYANNHKGYLLIYDINDLKNAVTYTCDGVCTDKKTRLEKVQYVKEQIDLSEDIEDYVRCNMMPTLGDVTKENVVISQRKLRDFMIQKAEEWQYEKEWRLVPRTIDLEKQSPLGYIECIPKGIILGAHCREEDRKSICAIAKEKNIPVFVMFLNEYSPAFKLDVDEYK